MDKELQDKINRCADWYLENGYSIIPIAEGKTPAIKWKDCIDKPLSHWDYPGCGIALLTGEHNGIVVVDCDNYDSYAAWLRHRPSTPLRVRTARGMHFYYRYPGSYLKSDSHIPGPEDTEYDVKGSKSYVLAPPSMRKGHQYQFCISSQNPKGAWTDNLPMFQMEWRPERVHDGSHESDERIKHVGSYISKIFAVQGNGGDKDTYRVCCKLAESDLSLLEQYQALLNWNAAGNATPPWDEASLRRKLDLAQKDVKNSGYEC